MKRQIILFAMLFAVVAGYSQELLTGTQYNEAIRHHLMDVKDKGIEHKSSLTDQSIELPFFDDFAHYTLFPDENLWIGKSVFVNRDFPLHPTNTGAATFDAIDETGALYTTADWIPFQADEMASRPIRLDSVFTPVTRALTPGDSLYFSFFYQPQGTGDEPEPLDSLILEFSRQGDTIFSHIDSATFSAQVWLEDINDTIKPLDTLWVPEEGGCNPELYLVSFDFYTWDDLITVPCDSVFAPDTIWDMKWYAEGMKLTEFREQNGGRDFVQVMIPIYSDSADSVYFYDAFQFRFRNYASIANNIIPSWKSNTDFWSIDYVYLNYNRNAGDTTYRDITFSQRAPSFLQDYQAMPYKQYRAGSTVSLLKSRFNMFIANLDRQERNSSYEYHVQQVNGDFSYDYYGGVCNLPPFELFGFQNCNSSCGAAHACPPVNSAFNFDFSRDTTSYIITHYISDSSEAEILIDSVSYTQGFYNYFAYDDGTPEFGYGLEPAGALMAYQFNLTMPDTLQGIQMYFNRTLNNTNEFFFNLKVWRDNNGEPGEEIYSGPSIKPKWTGKLYEFYPYLFEEPIIVTGTFYVGWQQQASGSLNIGFDANHDSKERVFYRTQDVWFNSVFPGSLLIRPIMGKPLVLGEDENPQQSSGGQLSLYPNPANGRFSIDQSGEKLDRNAQLRLYNIYGAVVHEQTGVEGSIDVAHLAKGMYIVRVNSNNRLYTGKLLINE
jgi:hypothetical protein